MTDYVKTRVKTTKPESLRANLSPRQGMFPRPIPSVPSVPSHITALHRTLGNQAVQRLYESGTIQAALKIGQPNDVYEKEADRVAAEVIRMPDEVVGSQQPVVSRGKEPSVQMRPGRPFTGCSLDGGEERIRLSRKTDTATGVGESSGLYHYASFLSGGRPLDRATRDYFEPRLGMDFSHVHVHTGPQAAESARTINAKAYTLGNNVIFGAGEYQPETIQGKRLLAHELTHVVQSINLSETNGTPERNTIRRELQSTLDEIDSLLSYGLLDWVITEDEAIRAVELLSGIPRNLLGTALQRVNIGRLRENLPIDHHVILNRLMAEAQGVPAADFNSIVNRINDLLSYGVFDWAITDREAREAFTLLKTLSPDDQRRAILVIDHQRLFDNLADERDRNELSGIRIAGLTWESNEYATMESYRTRARNILGIIKTLADSMTLPAPPANGVFESWLSSNYLTNYCANPGSTTAEQAIINMGETGSGGFATYGYQLLRGLADRVAPIIDYIDSPYLLGTPSNVTSGSQLWDPWSQGPNLTNIMHFATGVKYSHIPEAIIHYLFVWYERHSREGWQIFGLDALNDVIAEEGGRLFALDLKAGSVSCSAGRVNLDPYFQRGRSFLKSEISETRLDHVALAVHQPELVVAVDPAGNIRHSQQLWNATIMEQIMAGASDAVILASADAQILKILYNLARRG